MERASGGFFDRANPPKCADRSSFEVVRLGMASLPPEVSVHWESAVPRVELGLEAVLPDAPGLRLCLRIVLPAGNLVLDGHSSIDQPYSRSFRLRLARRDAGTVEMLT